MYELIEAVEVIRCNPDDHKDYEDNYQTGWCDACNAVLALIHVELEAQQKNRHPSAEPLAQKAYVAFVQICKGGSDDARTYDADEALVRRALRRLHELEGAGLAKPEPERLTVQEINNLPQHGENYIAECWGGEIQLDGGFSRADLRQLADSIPSEIV